jgi:hypothetical protein
MNRLLLAVTLCCASLALAAPVAGAETFSQNVSPGGSVSTGSAVSPADPIQMTVTTDSGGAITLDKAAAASRPDFEVTPKRDFGFENRPVYFGPSLTIRPTRSDTCNQTQDNPCATISTAVFLIEGSLVPRPAGGGGQEDALVWCARTPTAPSSYEPYQPCGGDVARNSEQVVERLPDGNVRLTLTRAFGLANGATFDFGRPLWLVKPNWKAGRFQDQDLPRDRERGGIQGGGGCQIECTWKSTITVSKGAARKLKLRSRTIAQGELRGETSSRRGYIPFTAEARKKLTPKALKRIGGRVELAVSSVVTSDFDASSPYPGGRFTEKLTIALSAAR